MDVAGLLTPAVGAVRQVVDSYKVAQAVIEGQPLEQAYEQYFPESKMLADAQKTPPYSKERFVAGFNVTAQMAMAAAGGLPGFKGKVSPKAQEFQQQLKKGGELTDGQRQGNQNIQDSGVGRSEAGAQGSARPYPGEAQSPNSEQPRQGGSPGHRTSTTRKWIASTSWWTQLR